MANIFEKLFAASDALQAGKQLKNAVLAKKLQIIGPYIVVIIGAIVKVTCTDCLSEIQIKDIAEGIAILISLGANHYLTVASTTKLGIQR
jgi:hypothetical protein